METYALLPLADGRFIKIDQDNFIRLSAYNYYECHGAIYRKIYINKRTVNIPISKDVMLNYSTYVMFDHIDRDCLNNCRTNLRLCTHRENLRNRTFPKTSSKYKGVTWDKQARKWRAKILVKGKTLHLGSFYDEASAGKAYDIVAKLHHKEFAVLNFPDV